MQYVAAIVNGLTLGSIYALVALGFTLTFRTVNVLDFGQGDKVVLGGLLALSLVHTHVPLSLAFLIVIAGGVFGGVIYDTIVMRSTIRRGPDAAVVATVGALLILSSGHVLIWGAAGQSFPALINGSLTIGKARVADQDFLVWVVVAAIVTAMTLFLSRARYGKAMVASAADPTAAGTVGIDAGRTRVVAVSLAFTLAMLAGVLIAPITLAGGVVGPDLTLKGFTAAVLGGLTSTEGAVVGGLLLGVFESLIGLELPFVYQEPIVFGLLIAVLLVTPNGLFGRGRRLA